MSDAELWRVVKTVATVVVLAGLWTWESFAPAMAAPGRWRHALRNLALALGNTILLALAFGAAAAAVVHWTHENQVGLLNLVELPWWLRLPLALLLLDLWLYLWHRANHAVELLWRFHRVHHADESVDVTTATRFHPGELVASASLRLLLVPLLGLEMRDLLIHDTLVVVATQFHHADISLGRADRFLRWLIVTPGLHAVHHSHQRQECDSNYGVVLSLWDRLGGTFRPPQGRITFGVAGLMGESWRSLPALLRLPFISGTAPRARPRPHGPAASSSARASK